MNQYHDLIDGDILRAADERHQTEREWLMTTTKSLTVATTNHDAAKRASDQAIAGTTGDPIEAEVGLETAARALSVATRVHAAADAAHRATVENLVTAKGEAHQPVFVRGVEMRLQAARKADAARAMLAEAEADYTSATDVLRFALQAGCRDAVYGQATGKPLTNYTDEFALWSRNFHNAWFQGLNDDGSVKETA
jgi:hypothetical protein